MLTNHLVQLKRNYLKSQCLRDSTHNFLSVSSIHYDCPHNLSVVEVNPTQVYLTSTNIDFEQKLVAIKSLGAFAIKRRKKRDERNGLPTHFRCTALQSKLSGIAHI